MSGYLRPDTRSAFNALEIRRAIPMSGRPETEEKVMAAMLIASSAILQAILITIALVDLVNTARK